MTHYRTVKNKIIRKCDICGKFISFSLPFYDRDGNQHNCLKCTEKMDN